MEAKDHPRHSRVPTSGIFVLSIIQFSGGSWVQPNTSDPIEFPQAP